MIPLSLSASGSLFLPVFPRMTGIGPRAQSREAPPTLRRPDYFGSPYKIPRPPVPT